MFSSKTLLYLLAVALFPVDASPLSQRDGKATLRFATRINQRGIMNIVENDRARAQALKKIHQLGKRSDSTSIPIITDSIPITTNGVHYVAEVGVGTPPTTYSLLIDTGSSNTFVGAGKAYVKTFSSIDTGNTASVNYGSGSWSGEEWLDTVTLGERSIFFQSIGVASKSSGLDDVDGILGVGPVDLTNGTVKNTGNVPTVLDNLYAQGDILVEALGVYFLPYNDGQTGELTFGGYDSSVISGTVDYVPLTKISPASTYWGIEQSITYGGQTVLASCAGIVDTGTTLIQLPTSAFQKYQSLTGGVEDSATSLLKITPSQYGKLQSLVFNIGSKSYSLSANGQIWPRSLNTAIGGTTDGIYLVVIDAGSSAEPGLEFLNGFAFLQRFYSVYDTTNQRIGFANTAYTDSTSN